MLNILKILTPLYKAQGYSFKARTSMEIYSSNMPVTLTA